MANINIGQLSQNHPRQYGYPELCFSKPNRRGESKTLKKLQMLLPKSVYLLPQRTWGQQLHDLELGSQVSSPLYATTGAGSQTRAHSSRLLFFCKQHLIRLHGIQEKQTYQRIQPETRLYISEGVGKKSMLIGRGSTVIRIQLQNKSYNKLFFKRKLTHIYNSHSSHMHSRLLFSVD